MSPCQRGQFSRSARKPARLGKLADLYGWGHIDEAKYRGERADIEASLAALAEDNRLVQFDRTRALVRTLSEAMAGASRDRLQELAAMVVERVEAAEREVAAIVWQAPARPFFDASAISTLGVWCPWRVEETRSLLTCEQIKGAGEAPGASVVAQGVVRHRPWPALG